VVKNRPSGPYPEQLGFTLPVLDMVHRKMLEKASLYAVHVGAHTPEFGHLTTVRLKVEQNQLVAVQVKRLGSPVLDEPGRALALPVRHPLHEFMATFLTE
jgi:hypothetical protein